MVIVLAISMDAHKLHYHCPLAIRTLMSVYLHLLTAREGGLQGTSTSIGLA